jgi:transcriptional antiterminator RfaH
MGLLGKEDVMHPSDLLTDFQQHSGRHWQVIYTKSRQEKAVARQFVREHVPFYLPTYAKQYRIRGRKMQSYLPLFPGYLFAFVDEFEQHRCFRAADRISRIMPVPDESQLVSDLINVKRLIESGAPLSVESRIQVGQDVRVKAGPLAGLEGYVLRRRCQTILFVAVNFLKQGVSLAIDDFMVERI